VHQTDVSKAFFKVDITEQSQKDDLADQEKDERRSYDAILQCKLKLIGAKNPSPSFALCSASYSLFLLCSSRRLPGW
jgi:hypothetical protein